MHSGEMDWAILKLKEALANPEGVRRYEIKLKLDRLAKLQEVKRHAQAIQMWFQVRKY